MDKNEFKDQAYGLISDIAKALSNPHRFEIMELLTNGSKSVEEIARESRISVANTSQHLQKLKQYNLVKTNRKGTTIIYMLANDFIITLIKSIHQVAYNQLPELKLSIDHFRKQFGTDKATIKTIPQEDHILLDVRPESEFNYEHRQGAINIPYNQLANSLDQLNKHTLIVAYCRGELCSYADEVVQQLNAAGFKAVRLKEIVMMKSA